MQFIKRLYIYDVKKLIISHRRVNESDWLYCIRHPRTHSHDTPQAARPWRCTALRCQVCCLGISLSVLIGRGFNCKVFFYCSVFYHNLRSKARLMMILLIHVVDLTQCLGHSIRATCRSGRLSLRRWSDRKAIYMLSRCHSTAARSSETATHPRSVDYFCT